MSQTKNLLLFGAVFGLILLTGFQQGWNVALGIFNMGLISAIMALGVNMQWGYAGLFNVGVMGFVALGGLATIIVAMLSIFVTIGLTPFAIAQWITPTWADIGVLFLVACFATAGHYTMTLAFAAAPVTVTQPVTFLQLVWAVLLGALVFAEPVDIYVVIGGAVILASVTFITWREAVVRGRTLTPTTPATKL